jgi:hypothetical protein
MRRAPGRSRRGRYRSFVAAITMPATTKTTIAAWVQSQNGDMPQSLRSAARAGGRLGAMPAPHSELGAGVADLGRRLDRLRDEADGLAGVLERLERAVAPGATATGDDPARAALRRDAVGLAVRGASRAQAAAALRGPGVEAVLDDVFGPGATPRA